MNIKKIAKSGKKYFISSFIMFATCFILGLFIKNDIASVIVKVIIGAIMYFLTLIILRDKYMYEIRDIVISKLNRKNKIH